MLFTILKRIRQQLVLLLAVSLVILAAYVSLGRQFMPAVANYTDFFEDQFQARTGIAISIESTEGSFQRFNPIIGVNGMSFYVNDNVDSGEVPEQALRLDSANAIIDVPRSIWERQLVLEDFVIDDVEINIAQAESGRWGLQGFDFGGGGEANWDATFNLFKRLARLRLTNVGINLIANDGDEFSLTNGSATIRNANNRHFVHINANPQGSYQQIEISLELEGDQLSTLDGQMHIDIPQSNYASLFSGIHLEQAAIEGFSGGGDVWLIMEDGDISEAIVAANVPSVTLTSEGSEPFTLSNIAVNSKIERDLLDNRFDVTLSNFSVSWDQLRWENFNAQLEYSPERYLAVSANHVDLTLLAQAAQASGFLPENVETQLATLRPRGRLENLSAFIPWVEGEAALSIRSNLNNLEIASSNGSPAIGGINGYVDATYDLGSRKATGIAEVESTNFRINIPKTFTRTWDYSYVNGAVNFAIDLSNGTDMSIVSSTIIANSDAVDGRAQFALYSKTPSNGGKTGRFELKVGAHRVDASQKALYLPDGPNTSPGLRETMEWLDAALISGDVYDSGVIYRGSTTPDSPDAAKTFQSYYQLRNGHIEFSEDWPQLQGLSGVVFTDDGLVDIEIEHGESMGMHMTDVLAVVEPNDSDENWLTIHGSATGETAQALGYLQESPLDENFLNTLASWRAAGGFSASIDVEVPFGQPDANTDVRLEIELLENDLVFPELALAVDNASGQVVFDTRTGLEPSSLVGRLFDREVEFSLSSQTTDGELSLINISGSGSVDPKRLERWPRHSSFVQDILRTMDGDFSYTAEVGLSLGASGTDANVLVIDTNLLGTKMGLPHPFSKAAEAEMPLHLEIGIGTEQQKIKGALGPALNFQLQTLDGELNSGVVYLGEGGSNLESLLESETKGVAITGNVDLLRLEEWTDFLGSLSTDPSSSQRMDNIIAFVDINADIFELYGEELAELDLRIQPSATRAYWNVDLNGDSMQGRAAIPFNVDDYIELDLQHLRIQSEELESLPVAELVAGLSVESNYENLSTDPAIDLEEEAIDVLAGIDPRELPKLQFATDELSIEGREFGSWQFTLEPTRTGADIRNLVFDFRGLRLGLDEEEAEGEDDEETDRVKIKPGFKWYFDGENHRSELSGILYADNMADVLTANGYAASLESSHAVFETSLSWPGSPAFFGPDHLSGRLIIDVEDGRFLQGSGSTGALKLISILNMNAIMSRLRLSNDLTRSGLAFDEISGDLVFNDGVVTIQDQLRISGPSSLYQISGDVDLANETINGEMYITLPVSSNIPWIGVLTANIPLAVGAFLFDKIFGAQVNSLTSAVYTLEGSWEGLEPQFKQAFGSPTSNQPSEVDQ